MYKQSAHNRMFGIVLALALALSVALLSTPASHVAAATSYGPPRDLGDPARALAPGVERVSAIHRGQHLVEGPPPIRSGEKEPCLGLSDLSFLVRMLRTPVPA